MSKPILYTFTGSVWAAVPELAIHELGYQDDIEIKVINLVKGENFAPAFVKINPNATLPTLEADGKVYTNTTDVTSYLVKNAQTKVQPGTDLIKLFHEPKYDPNFSLLLARDDEELKTKGANLPGAFLANRQEALLKIAPTPEAAPHKQFYDAKIAGNGGLLAIYQGKVPDAVKLGFFAESQAHFGTVSSVFFEMLPPYLPESGFVGGKSPGEDDFHVGAWLARICATVGAKTSEEGLKALEKAFGKPVQAKVAAYWNAWIERPSWKMVYADGPH